MIGKKYLKGKTEEFYKSYTGDEIFLKSLVKDTVENKEFDKFTGILELNFTQVFYKNCTFKDIEFKYINFSNVIFENCFFQGCNFYHCSIEHESVFWIVQGNLKECCFNLCNLSGIMVKRCKLSSISFKDVDLSKCNFVQNSFNLVKFIDDCSLVDCTITEPCCCFGILFINEKSYSKLSYGSYLGSFNYTDHYYCIRTKKDYPCEKKDLSISNSYMAFGNQYLKNDIQDKYGECFYQSKIAKHRTLKGTKRLVSSISNYVCGYGEKPFRSFGASLVFMIVYALIYLFSGIGTDSRVINYESFSMPRGLLGFLEDLLYCIHFSVVTFSTTGYGDLVPYGKLSIFIANIEIITGVIMVAIWTSTLVRKMTR